MELGLSVENLINFHRRQHLQKLLVILLFNHLHLQFGFVALHYQRPAGCIRVSVLSEKGVACPMQLALFILHLIVEREKLFSLSLRKGCLYGYIPMQVGSEPCRVEFPLRLHLHGGDKQQQQYRGFLHSDWYSLGHGAKVQRAREYLPALAIPHQIIHYSLSIINYLRDKHTYPTRQSLYSRLPGPKQRHWQIPASASWPRHYRHCRRL